MADVDDMGGLWRDYRQCQKARRANRLPARTQEIRALRGKGFSVRELTPYQFRVDERLDLYPIHRNWHDTKTNTRGTYKAAVAIAIQRLRTKGE